MKENIFDKFRRLIHPTLLKVLKSTRKHNLRIVNEQPDVEQAIYVVNHYDVNDIPVALESIGKHTYVLISNEDRFTPGGFMLSLNGAVWFKRTKKKSRQKAAKKVLKHLAKGHRVLVYPEATWNLSPNLLMLPMNYGVIGFSQDTNVPLFSIGTYDNDNNYNVKFGELFYPKNDKIEEIKKLRDALATIRFELMSEFPITKRADITDSYWEDDIARRYNAYKRARKDPEGVRKYESQFIFKSKDIVTEEEAFANIDNIRNDKGYVYLLKK